MRYVIRDSDGEEIGRSVDVSHDVPAGRVLRMVPAMDMSVTDMTVGGERIPLVAPTRIQAGVTYTIWAEMDDMVWPDDYDRVTAAREDGRCVIVDLT